MLLKEEEIENGVFVSYYDSSNVWASKYIYSEKKLAIIFSKGQQYIYDNVLPYHYQRFKVAKSQGVSLREHILKNYSHVRVEDKLDGEMMQQISETISKLQK